MPRQRSATCIIIWSVTSLLLSSTESEVCEDVGSYPGRWFREQWRPVNTSCELLEWPGVPPGSKLRVWFLGDSVDRMTANDAAASNASVCCATVPNLWKPDKYCADEHPCDAASAIEITYVHILGVWPEGPFLQDPAEEGLTGKETWRKVLTSLNNAPDILVFSSNFWDILRWAQLQPHVLETSGFGEQDIFLPELTSWQQHFQDFMHHLQDTLPPHTTKIYHTTAMPNPASCGSSNNEQDGLGHHEHVQQLNAVGRYQAQRIGWHIVDFELMALQFHSPELYLRDKHHPAPWFTSQVFQMYLNIHAAQVMSNRKEVQM